MNHIKKFNETFEMDTKTMNVVNNDFPLKKDIESWREKIRKRQEDEDLATSKFQKECEDEVPHEKFKEMLIEFEKNLDTDFEGVTSELRDFKDKFPFIKQIEPYKKMYWDFVKKWHKFAQHKI